eukprot:COSAG06_NODE_3375_length_5434_cov_3.763074_1_plen_57_part_00
MDLHRGRWPRLLPGRWTWGSNRCAAVATAAPKPCKLLHGPCVVGRECTLWAGMIAR